MKDFDKTKVYVYCDPRYSGNYEYEFNSGILRLKFKPFYIGCAKGNDYLRHLHKGTRSSERVIKRIKKIRREGLEPIVKVLRSYSLRNKALKLEEKLIVLVGRQDLKTGPLLNRVDGGIGGKNPNKNRRRELKKVMKGTIENLWKNPEFKKKHIEKAKQQWKSFTFREMKIKKAKEQWESSEYRKEMSKKFKKAWKKPNCRVKHSGENNGRAKLTDEKVLEIRETYKKGGFFQQELAEKYNVSQTCIQRIITRYNWIHI